MGQHRTNPVAQAYARGEISKSTRTVARKTPPFNERELVLGKVYRMKGMTVLRAIPKVRGKANVKRAKKARQAARLANAR